jgi:hypothetical protein
MNEPSPTPVCYILGQNRATSTGSAGNRFWTVAGTKNCGFSGDGGLATGAEISKNIGSFAFDAAGNFYFTDTGNNRIRRIDAATGIIHTIAGTGAAIYGGDYGMSTSAPVWAPTGLATDSMGNVYTIAQQNSSGNDDVREFGQFGLTNFPAQAIGTSSAAQTVMVSNVGNDELNFTHVGFYTGNTGDFALDANNTTCNFTVPLYSGQNCLIGIIFTPSAVGARSTQIRMTDDTAGGINYIIVNGTGAAPAKAAVSPTSLSFPSQTVGTTSAATGVTLSNTGGAAMTISSYTFTGTNATDFNQGHNCGATLAAGATCIINVNFKPAAAGSRSASLSVATSGGTATVALTGTGVTSPNKSK